WRGGAQLPEGHPNGWRTEAPSSIPYRLGENAPTALARDGLVRICEAFADAARRAVRIGRDAIQLHADFDHAESILVARDADLVALAGAMIYDPVWPWQAAAHFGAGMKAPGQYLRLPPTRYRNSFDYRASDCSGRGTCHSRRSMGVFP